MKLIKYVLPKPKDPKPPKEPISYREVLLCGRCGSAQFLLNENLCSACYSWATYAISQGAHPTEVFLYCDHPEHNRDAAKRFAFEHLVVPYEIDEEP